MRSRSGPAVIVTTAFALALAVPASAATNPWLERRVLNMAHQGGEFEAPSNTIYAFERALKRGADMLELDVHASRDGKLMVIHDSTVDRTTNGRGYVSDMTRRQVQRLDAAHNFVPSRNAVRGLPRRSYPLRGVRSGDRPPPSGYRRRDFRVPTLAEVFRRFPDTPTNIEIKGKFDSDQESFDRNAELLARFLNRRAERAGDVIVVSFNQDAVARFHARAPRFGTAPGVLGVAGFFAAGLPPGNGAVALQVPVEQSGLPVATKSFVDRAHAAGLAVHVFLDADDEETAATYRQLVQICVDGLMTAYPTRLNAFLERERIRGPGRRGRDPCSG
jgi:glycerophosphoryl diester phosphodiesterase